MNRESLKSARGSANTKLVAVLTMFFLIGNAGYNLLPVVYQGASFKQEMQTAVVNGVSMPVINKSAVDVVREKLAGQIRANGIPTNAWVQVKQLNNVVQARVAYTQPVNVLPFGLYTYNYKFDFTATPGGFLANQ
jgi:hypothetical protein